MGQSQEPSRTEASDEVRLHVEHLYEKIAKTAPRNRVASALTWTLLLAAGSVGVLVCLTLGEFPWHIQWVENGHLSLTVTDGLIQLKTELAGIGLVVFSALLIIAIRAVEMNGAASLANAARYTIDWEKLDNNGKEGQLEVFDVEQQSLLIDQFGEALAEQSQPQQNIDLEAVNVCDLASDYQRKSYADAQLRVATDELSRVRRELVASRQQLDATNKAQKEFVISMSHELRTPMSGIIGMADLLLSGELGAREQRFAQSIAESSNSLLLTINDLFDFTRIESRKANPDSKKFSLKDCIEDVCASLNSVAEAKQIGLICHIDEAIPAQVEGDPTRVSQVVHNLVSNAISATQEGEVVVRLTCKERSKGLSVYQCDVQDTGVGISPEAQLDLFETMTQAQSTSVQERRSAGRGLVISTELLSQMNGELSFKSRLGEGSRFRFTMELTNITTSTRSQAAQRTLSVTKSRLETVASTLNLKVLLVEDCAVNQNVAIGVLEQLGCYVTLAVDGAQAVEMSSLGKYDIVLMDDQISTMGDYEATRKIKSDKSLNASTPVIALTTPALDRDRKRSLAAGMDDYVSKPVQQDVLSHMFQKWLGREDDRAASNARSLGSLTSSAGVKCDLILSGLCKVDLDLGDPSELNEPNKVQDNTMQVHGSVGVPIHQTSPDTETETLDVTVSKLQKKNNVSPINFKAIDTIRGLQRAGKDDLLAKVVGVYLDRTPEIIEAMADSVKAADAEGLSISAHSLKSSSEYLGAESIFKACQLLEAAVRENDYEEAAKLVSGIRSEYERVYGALGSLVKAA